MDLKVAEELSGPDVGREGCKKLARLVSNVLQWVRKDYKSSPKTDTGSTQAHMKPVRKKHEAACQNHCAFQRQCIT